MKPRRLCGFTALVLFGLTTSRLQAQSTKAEMFGTLRDPAGLPVSAAALELVNTGTQSKIMAESDANGGYHFFALTAGSYQISVVKAGFSTLRRDGIVIRVGEQLSVDLQLQVGDVSQSVVVTAAAPLLKSTRGTASFNMEQKKVVSLPLDGRNFVPLIARSPGVNLP